MPTYTIKDMKENHQWDVFLSWDSLQIVLDENPHWVQVIGAPKLVRQTGNGDLKVDDGFREVMSKIKDSQKINNIRDY